ncbi:MAG: type IX secretion system outer membrane channel protein PorV [Bacteroidetes bacterium]|nr:type IX secretion system outer membrane channel protein PorV [Bacteroidota bacterium]
MSKRNSLIGLGLVACLFSASAQAQNKSNVDGSSINTITTAVPFLRISPDARSGAMGDAGIAISADANAQYWNIGKMPFNEKNYGLSLTYTPWLKDLVPDIFLAYISGYTKFGENHNQAISASLRYFSLGDINYVDINASPTGTGKPREFSLDLGYSRKLSEVLSAGVSLRYIHSNIASGLAGGSGADYKPGNTAAADVGIYYTKTNEIDEFRKRNFSFGAVISNLGGKMSYSSTRKDFIPINLGLGIAYTSKFDEFNKITFALDVNKLLVPTPLDSSTSGTPAYYYPDKTVVSGVLGSFGDAPGGFNEELREFNFSLGAEYWYQDQFALRAGYYYEDKTKGDRKYFTVGLGVKYNVFTLNGAYIVPSGSGISRNPLSNTLRFTLGFDFNDLTAITTSSSDNAN